MEIQISGRIVWNSLLEIKGFSHVESRGRGPRNQPWGVSTFRGEAEEEELARPEGNQQDVGEAKRKCFKGGVANCVDLYAERHHGWSKMGGGWPNC